VSAYILTVVYKRKEGVTPLRKKPWFNLLAGLLIFTAGSIFGYWLTTFFGEPPLESPPTPLKELAEDLKDLAEGDEGTEEPEAYPFPEGTEKERRDIESQDLVKLYPDLVFRQGDPGKKQIALTFDDGPDATFTPMVLDILKDNNVKATFFVTGVRAEQFPDVLKRMADEGHSLANHGYYHKDFTTLTAKEIETDMQKNSDLVARVTGHQMNLFRPPYGALNTRAIEAIKNAGYKIILWNIDSLDWMNLPKEDVIKNIIPEANNGAIVLQHSAGGPGQDLTGSVEALPVIISTLKEKEYSFATIHELLGISPVPRR
jgi:peptidoglycan/xylan/chitin deacetylase (PgdA/CDA1 family)